MILVECPVCSRTSFYLPSCAGLSSKCLHCDETVRVPGEPQQLAPPDRSKRGPALWCGLGVAAAMVLVAVLLATRPGRRGDDQPGLTPEPVAAVTPKADPEPALKPVPPQPVELPPLVFSPPEFIPEKPPTEPEPTPPPVAKEQPKVDPPKAQATSTPASVKLKPAPSGPSGPRLNDLAAAMRAQQLAQMQQAQLIQYLQLQQMLAAQGGGGPGMEWVNGHYRNGKWVNGYWRRK